MYQVLKRDGTTVDCEISKISGAMIKAFDALGRNYHPSVINLLALQVTSAFEMKIKDGMISVEDIQDSVEQVLSESGYADVAKVMKKNCKQVDNLLYRAKKELRIILGKDGEQLL